MAERTIMVCDVCGEPATASAAIRAEGKSLTKDLCATHLQEIVRNARSARRGRPRMASLVRRAKGKPTETRRSRPSRRAAAAAPTKRSTRRATNPETLRKRRAAMAKAREGLAAKRAAAKKEIGRASCRERV